MALYENTIANAFAFGGEASKDIKCPDLHLVDHSLTQEKKHFFAKRQCFETYLPSPQSGMGNPPIWSPWAVRAGQSLGGRPGGPFHFMEGQMEARDPPPALWQSRFDRF